MIRLFQPSDLEPMVAIARKAWKKIFEGFRQQLGDELYSISTVAVPSTDPL